MATEKHDFVITHAQEWMKKRSIPELIELRNGFFEATGSECTCDYCISVTFCALAYDYYNCGGDCLYEK